MLCNWRDSNIHYNTEGVSCLPKHKIKSKHNQCYDKNSTKGPEARRHATMKTLTFTKHPKQCAHQTCCRQRIQNRWNLQTNSEIRVLWTHRQAHWGCIRLGHVVQLHTPWVVNPFVAFEHPAASIEDANYLRNCASKIFWHLPHWNLTTTITTIDASNAKSRVGEGNGRS
jgi:hypothetical protein